MEEGRRVGWEGEACATRLQTPRGGGDAYAAGQGRARAAIKCEQRVRCTTPPLQRERKARVRETAHCVRPRTFCEGGRKRGRKRGRKIGRFNLNSRFGIVFKLQKGVHGKVPGDCFLR
jgi:hypothetical protein